MTNALRAVALMLLMFVLCAPCGALARCDPNKDAPCSVISPWYDGNVVHLETRRPDQHGVSRFTLTVHDPLNLTIDVDNVSQERTQKGTLKLVEGRAMLTRGLVLAQGQEIDALDGPILTYRLLISLLSRSISAGPNSVSGTQALSITEEKNPIRLATNSASLDLMPPWTLDGTVNRKDDETVEFSLRLTNSSNGTPAITLFNGSWYQRKHVPQQDYSMSLAGWQYYSLGIVISKLDDRTHGPSNGADRPLPFSTLGDLRNAIIANK